MEPLRIRYSFRFGKDLQEVFDLQFDPQTMALLSTGIPLTGKPPDWARLTFFQCHNCPLDEQEHPYCPIALNMVSIVERFDTLFSYNETHMVVTTKERIISQITTIQRAVSSMTGLIISASGCPLTGFFKPMGRFHLPLSDGIETIYRAASTYLLAQYFLHHEGLPIDFGLRGLQDIYHNIQTVNLTLANRLRATSKSDSVLNAIVELDVFAQTLSLVIEDSLDELRPLFQSYLSPPSQT